jgi:hypothetical protein
MYPGIPARRASAIAITVRGEPVEPPLVLPLAFDKLRPSGQPVSVSDEPKNRSSNHNGHNGHNEKIGF